MVIWKNSQKNVEYNSLLPYDFVKESEYNYAFVTSEGVAYRAYFVAVPYLHPLFTDTYSFNIEPKDGSVVSTHRAMDARIGATIAAILTEFFKKNENSMIMVCDNSDGREHKRRLLFDRWYNTYNDKSLMKLDAAFEKDDYRLFVSMYISVANPKRRELVDAFNELVRTDLYELAF